MGVKAPGNAPDHAGPPAKPPVPFEVATRLNLPVGAAALGPGRLADAALQGAALGMQKSLGQLKQNGRLDEDPTVVVPFLERQRMVNKPYFDELEKKYTY